MKFLAKTIEGLEEVLSNELLDIGAKNVEILNRAVSYEGGLNVLYKSNILLRTALKVLVPITEVEVQDENHLYQEVHALPWDKIFSLNDTFAVDATVSGEIFTHSKYISLKTKDAIVDKFRRKHNARPNVNPVNPNFRINVHIRGNILTLSLDSSGESLHRRGYRVQPIEAPLNEVLAAGLILLTGWKGQNELWDPMSGSGTIGIEAARIAMDIPPQSKDRSYAFQNWHNYDAKLYDTILSDAFDSKESKPLPKISSTDKSIQSITSSRINIQEAQLTKVIKTERLDFFKAKPVNNVTIIVNPPYDQRLKVDDINRFYKNIGDHLKQNCIDSEAWIFSGNIDAIKSIGLKPNQKFNLNNGPIESKFYKFEIYKGSLDEEE